MNRRDTISPKGGPPASDVEFVRQHLLDRCGVGAAILIPLQAMNVEKWQYPDEAGWFVTAWNNALRDMWLSADPRFHMAMTVSPLDPTLAAAEIRRFGETDRVVAVLLPLVNIPFGQRHYYPIYEAASELGLPVMTHPINTSLDYVGCTQLAGGLPTHAAERYALLPQIAQTHLTSLIFEGAFERYPQLQIAFVEWGWSWLPGLLWRLDATWKAGRYRHPWMKKSPTEYVRKHVRFTTQPALECPNDAYLRQIVEMMHGDDVLMFSSDYPHWDSEEPFTAFKAVSDDVRARIFHDNAAAFFGSRLQMRSTVERT